MDEQQLETKAKDAAAKLGETASELAARTRANVQGTLDQGKAILQDLKTSSGDAMEKASAAARDLSAAGTQAAAQAGELIKGVAREVGNQAGQAATTLYQQGTNARGYLNRYVAEQPMTALLLAAAVGFGLAYMVRRR